MVNLRIIGVLLLLWLLPLTAGAECRVAPDSLRRNTPDKAVTDSLDRSTSNRSDRLYDTLRARSERKRWSRTIYRALLRSERDSIFHAEVRDETAVLAPYVGRTITSIRIERLRPFDSNGNWFEQAANTLHTQTRHRIIHRDLLFKVGEKFDPDLVTRTEQLLQSRRHISEVTVHVLPDPTDTMQVEVVVRTRDSWTLDVDASVHSHGESSFGLSESNLFGRGHRVRLETNLNYSNYGYGGNVIEYAVPNAWGSFYAFNFAAGRSFHTTRFNLGVQKDFLKPTDYELGVTYTNDKVKYRFLERDTTDLVKSRDLNLWAGYARYLAPINASVYLTARYNHRRFSLRPDDTAEQNHSALHDCDALLFGLGLYRENFYTANMIYGYGQREYLTAGFKTELVGGYCWLEFNNCLYAGLSHSMGNYTRIGYLMGNLSVGRFFDTETSRWKQGVLDFSVRWFSNLGRLSQSRVRHFVGLSYTYGWDRTLGAGEQIRFTKEDGLHLMSDPIVGTNRLVINTESVLFTPYQPLGFKVALFGFIDGGTIGFRDNPFRNDGFLSLGLGVRIRNERLVFNAIQLRLGVAFGPNGFAESPYFRFSSASAMQQYRYRPTRPEFVAFE